MYGVGKQIGTAAVLVIGLLVGGIATAAPIVMTFDGMAHAKNGEWVDNYYNGGCGGSYAGGAVDCNGPDYGVVWNGALAGGAPDGLWSDRANEPSSPNVMGFLSTSNAVLNVAAGFDTGFSFYYAAPEYRGALRIYSGLDGTGTILANVAIPKTAGNCSGFSEEYSCWDTFGVAFSGVAKSVKFIGRSNFVGFDNVTLGSTTPLNPVAVPEPAALGMFGLGALLIGLFAGLRRHAQQS